MIEKANRLKLVGEYYFSRKMRELSSLSGNPIINLGIGNPDLPPSTTTIDSFEKTLKMTNIHGYQPYNGLLELRQAYSSWYEKYFSVVLNPEDEVLPLAGSKEGIIHISLAFLNPGDDVLIPNPGYRTYSAAAQLVSANPIYYDLVDENNWYPDFEQLFKCNMTNVKVMWVNYPHMPTGAKGNSKLFHQLIEFGRKNDVLICHDNPYSFILNHEPLSILSLPQSKEIAIELNSLSKSHNMAGWRVGVALGKPEFVSAILQAKSNMDSGQFLPIQKAAIQALNNPSSWLDELNAKYQERRQIIYQILDILNCKYSANQAGLFVWAKIPSTFKSGEDFSDWLLEKYRIFVVPGVVFGSNGENYIRVSLCADINLLNRAKDNIV